MWLPGQKAITRGYLLSVAAGDVGGEVGGGAGRPWERAPGILAVSWAGTWGQLSLTGHSLGHLFS